MQLPNPVLLKKRLDELLHAGQIKKNIYDRLLSENQAGDDNRANMIWFCFFAPKFAGEMGIRRLFTSWGGEALYNSHESNPETGVVLTQIGCPCVIEALVPILSLKSHSLEIKMARHYSFAKQLSPDDPGQHEGYTLDVIASANIIKIHQHPRNSFNTLTDSQNWTPKLTGVNINSLDKVIAIPSQIDETTLTRLVKFINSGGEVNTTVQALKRAYRIAYYTDEGKIVCSAVIKTPVKTYVNRIFKESQSELDQDEFPVELGYITTAKEYEGNKVCQHLLNQLSLHWKSKNIFATTRKPSMIHILNKHGFQKTGLTYKENLNLLIRQTGKWN